MCCNKEESFLYDCEFCGLVEVRHNYPSFKQYDKWVFHYAYGLNFLNDLIRLTRSLKYSHQKSALRLPSYR